MNPIQSALAAVTLGLEVTFENLSMVPLLIPPDTGSRIPHPDYVLLDDALSSRGAEITEVSEQGSVPELRFVNRGKSSVLIIDGQELLGAKQNRIVNLTILVPAGIALTIPVTCVEAGRWRARSRAFSAAPRTQYASARARRVADVTQSIAESGERNADQAWIWDDIAAKSERLHARSSTGAMEAMFDRHSSFIDRAVAALRPVERQVGAIFCVHGRVIGLDLFDRATTLQRILPLLVQSVAVDALDRSPEAALRSLDTGVAQQFLAQVGSASQHSFSALGRGEDVRLSAPGLVGAALVVDGCLVHVTAFASV